VLEGEASGVEQCLGGLAGVLTLTLGAGHVDKQLGPGVRVRDPTRRCRGNVERFACVSDVDGNRDSVQLHVGGTELGLEVVALPSCSPMRFASARCGCTRERSLS
jgi:hypothetical protein